MSNDFGELVLVLGDFHIPQRTTEIPEKFQKMLVPNKMHHILCTGELITKEVYEKLRTLAPNVHVTRGVFDEIETFPEEKIVTIGQFRIGMCHGHQIVPWGDPEALSALQRKMNVDILVTGHTHEHGVFSRHDKWFVNPGSITGAYNNFTSAVLPSFILMAIQGAKVVIYVYELKNDTVVVSKSEFSKIV